jgi:hypothetical protein
LLNQRSSVVASRAAGINVVEIMNLGEMGEFPIRLKDKVA